MHTNEMINYGYDTFEGIKHTNEYGQEFWYARDLQGVLGYVKWDKFQNVVERAKISCETSGYDVDDHFLQVGKMVDIGSGAEREIDDVMLTRYACYLIVQNGDPRKEVIALGQTYFAVKTRQQELVDNYEELTEEQKRIAIRAEMKKHNKSLAEAAHNAGVKTGLEFAVFQNYGYRGLYDGMDKRDIARHKGLDSKADILDYMGSTELAANLFRATQTEEKLRRDKVQGAYAANATHYAVGKKVRETIAELGGTMPENLPTPEKSVKQLEREKKKKLASKEQK